MANDWPSRSSTFVSARRVASAGIRKPCSVMPLAKSSVLTSGATFSRMTSPAMVGVNVSLMPNSLYIDRHGAVRAGALDDRNRNLAAGQKARFLAVVGDQVRLGEALEEALRLQRLDERAEAFLVIEEEQVQEIAEDQSAALLSIVDGRAPRTAASSRGRNSPAG